MAQTLLSAASRVVSTFFELPVRSGTRVGRCLQAICDRSPRTVLRLPEVIQSNLRPPPALVSTASVKLGFLISIFCVSSGHAQQYDVSGLLGYGVYRDVRINSADGTATAGIRNRFTAGALIGEDLYSHISGEIRYLYHDGDPFLSTGSVRGNIQGQSHTFNYDALFHVYDRDRRFRPFVAIGIGGKYYRTSGPAPVPQPLPQIASLVMVNQWQFVTDVGFGFKYRLRNHLMMRGDFRDYITPFPKKLFAPSANGTDRGLFQQFTPTLGIGYWF